MSSEGLRNWISGIVFHTHSRLDRLLIPYGYPLELENNYDSLVSIEALVWYAKKFSGDSDVLVCDTDHPMHFLDREGIPREGSFEPNELTKTIAIISRGVLWRAEILRSSHLVDNVLTGIEADILNTEGLVDVDDEALSRLDIVIASLHYSYWKSANGGLKPDKGMYIGSLRMAAGNPNIDVIGHPTRDLQPTHIEQMEINDWDNLFETMARKRVAYEINLHDHSAGLKASVLEKKLIRRAVEHGVSFIVGLDFHNFHEYLNPIEDGRYIDIHSMPEIFQIIKGEANFRLFMQMRKIKRELDKLGVNSNNLVNIDRQHFREWLTRRNEK